MNSNSNNNAVAQRFKMVKVQRKPSSVKKSPTKFPNSYWTLMNKKHKTKEDWNTLIRYIHKYKSL